MKLLDYLNTKFSVQDSTWTVKNIENDFTLKFGVNITSEPHTDGKMLIQAKYDMISAKWTEDLTHECRGVILRNSNEGWEIMARPFDKFFNQHEGHCRIFNEEDFKKEIPNLSFVKKEDGTCIIFWFDKYKTVWRVSTLGTITTMNINDSNMSFETLFRNTVSDYIDQYFDKECVYLFELCTTLNRVVSRYAADIAYLIGMRKKDGELASYKEIEKKHEGFIGCWTKILLPDRTTMSSLNITNLQEAQAWVESQSKATETVEYPEGFVVYDNYGPVCKMKNSMYLALHHSLSDPACTRKSVIASFFKGTMDDLYPALPKPFQEFADNLKNWLNDFKVYLNTQVALSFKREPFATRKDYALYVQGLPQREGMFRAFFFSNQEKVCDPNSNLGEDFSKWIVQNYEKYEDYWKSLYVL